MNFRKTITRTACLVSSVWIFGMGLTSCHKIADEGMVIFTLVPADRFHPPEESPVQHYPGAQLVALDMENPAGSETILTAGFESASSPDISYDASRMLFLARKEKQDTWQVWEMELKTGKTRKITDFKESCSGPAYLPGDRLLFSRQMPDEGFGSTCALFTMNLDGTNLNRITFQPHCDNPATILMDGRVLMLTRQLYPETGDPMYLAMRPNGTKTELFHKSGTGYILGSQAKESLDGHVYFTRWGKGSGRKADLLSVHRNRPLYTVVNHSAETPGDFYGVFPLPSGDLLISYQSPETSTAGLYQWSPSAPPPGEMITGYPDFHILEPVLLEPYTRPRHLPDEVNKNETTGQLFCQDINVSALRPDSGQVGFREAHMIEVLGLDRSMGIVPVEEDGSFYLKVIADTPFRLRTLDESGEVVHGPSGWLWLRPFERRGCVGCHEDPELVPKNFVPLAVKKQPVSIPEENIRGTNPGPAVKKTE